MPSTMGYVRGTRSQPVHYPETKGSRAAVPPTGGGRPMRASSNTIRQALKRRRAKVHGISVMPEVGSGKIISSRPHRDRGQPPAPASARQPNSRLATRNQAGFRKLAGGGPKATFRGHKVRRGPLKGYTQG